MTGLGRLTGTVAKELTDSKLVKWFTDVDGPRSVDLQLVWKPLKEWFTVETWLYPVNGGCIYVPAALPLGFKSRRGRTRAQ